MRKKKMIVRLIMVLAMYMTMSGGTGLWHFFGYHQQLAVTRPAGEPGISKIAQSGQDQDFFGRKYRFGIDFWFLLLGSMGVGYSSCWYRLRKGVDEPQDT